MCETMHGNCANLIISCLEYKRGGIQAAMLTDEDYILYPAVQIRTSRTMCRMMEMTSFERCEALVLL